jgi:hypothetical protein
MQSTAARVGLLAALAALAVVLFIVLSSGDDEDSGADTQAATTDATVTQGAADGELAKTAVAANIVVKNGEPTEGVLPIDASKGDEILLTIEVDPPEEEIHVHGYEITEPARKSPVQLAFPADLDGLFAIELHRTDGSEVVIAELRVNP